MLLEDAHDPYDDGFEDWLSRSIHVLERHVGRGNLVHFDLTNMRDMENVLKGEGQYAGAVTTGELLYIRKHWGRLAKSVKFYRNDAEVDAPWQS